MDPSTILMDDPFFDILKRCERNKTEEKTQKSWKIPIKILVKSKTKWNESVRQWNLCGDDNENVETQSR